MGAVTGAVVLDLGAAAATGEEAGGVATTGVAFGDAAATSCGKGVIGIKACSNYGKKLELEAVVAVARYTGESSGGDGSEDLL